MEEEPSLDVNEAVLRLEGKLEKDPAFKEEELKKEDMSVEASPVPVAVPENQEALPDRQPSPEEEKSEEDTTEAIIDQPVAEEQTKPEEKPVDTNDEAEKNEEKIAESADIPEVEVAKAEDENVAKGGELENAKAEDEKSELAVEEPKAKETPKIFLFNDEEQAEEKVEPENVDQERDYSSGIWLFTDRENITHFFEPNFLPPYDTPDKRKIILDVLKEEWDERTLSWKPCGQGSTSKIHPIGQQSAKDILDEMVGGVLAKINSACSPKAQDFC